MKKERGRASGEQLNMFGFDAVRTIVGWGSHVFWPEKRRNEESTTQQYNKKE